MKLTPTQCRIYNLLADGELHSLEEMAACLWDDMADDKANSVRIQVCLMRKVLIARGQDVTCRGSNGGSKYRLVQFLEQAIPAK